MRRVCCFVLGIVVGCSSPPAARAPAPAPVDLVTPAGQAAACNAGDANACFALGLRYYTADGVGDRDDAKAASLFARACEHKDVAGCGWHGVMMADGEGIAKDEARAVVLLRPACTAKVQRA